MARGDGFRVFKRKRGGRELRNYDVRVWVPSHLRAAVGKNEVLRSLGTGDWRSANRAALGVVARLYAEWDSLASKGAAGDRSAPDTSQIAVRVAFDGMLAAMEDLRKEWPADDLAYGERISQRETELQRMTRRFQAGDLSQWVPVAARVIETRSLPITVGSQEFDDFVRELARANLDAIDVFLRRSKGDLDAEPRSLFVREVNAKSAAKAAPGESLSDLFELWAEEMLAKGGKRPDTVAQDRKVITQFTAFVGTDRDVRSITALEVADYRDTLRRLPPKWMSKKELRGLGMRAAAQRARDLNLRQTAFTNVNKHLSTISPLYKYLAQQPKWAGLPNPCTGLFYAKVKGKNARPPFSTDDLNAILKSPLFTGFRADGEEHVAGETLTRDWRFWIPLVTMFTGARIGEVAQLRLNDVVQENGVSFIHIRHDTSEGLATKSGKSRPAAVHPVLEKIGFLAHHKAECEARGASRSLPLFPELAPNDRGQISAAPSRWWREYLVAIGLKDPDVEGGDGLGSHSFRHTLADRLRVEAELLDNEVAVCLGHSSNTTTSQYGKLPQGTVRKFEGWMKAVTFEGVDFSHLLGDVPEQTPAGARLTFEAADVQGRVSV